MPKPSDTAVPSYRLHEQSGQAVVTLDGRDIRLGVRGNQGMKTWRAAADRCRDPLRRHTLTLKNVAGLHHRMLARTRRGKGLVESSADATRTIVQRVYSEERATR